MSTPSAIVITYNEEKHIRDCLASLAWCDQVWVVDSNSTDRTLDVAREFPVQIAQMPTMDFSSMRQWTLEHLDLRQEWVLFLDSDERITPELAAEIPARIGAEPYAGYWIPGKQYFWGKWLRHGEASPYYQLKLFRRDAAHYDGRPVHERAVIAGEVGFMKHPMIHLSRETMAETIHKMNRYTTADAIRMYRTGQELYTPASGSYSKGNAVLKAMFKYLPGKPFVKFLYDYVVKQGFRDGYIGFIWAVCQGLYVFLAYFKLWELKRGIVKLEEPATRRSDPARN